MSDELSRPVVIACRSLRPELEILRPDDGSVEILYLEQILHRTPTRMPAIIQQAIDRVEHHASRIVLAYGLCSNGVVGLFAKKQQLVIPRVHDCIALLLGSREAYDQAFVARPGVYYLTPGWIEESQDPLGYMERDYVPRLGREAAVWGLKEELKHYSHITLIDTRVTDMDPLRARARENARFLDKEYAEVTGEQTYFAKILFGPYDEDDFIILEPGEQVTQKLFF